MSKKFDHSSFGCMPKIWESIIAIELKVLNGDCPRHKEKIKRERERKKEIVWDNCNIEKERKKVPSCK